MNPTISVVMMNEKQLTLLLKKAKMQWLRRFLYGLVTAVLIVLTTGQIKTVETRATAAAAGPNLTVDAASSSSHRINPNIYGVTFFWDNNGSTPDPINLAFAKETKLPLNRSGGDSNSRYNWQVDASNAGSDWYFMGGNGQSNSTAGASADAFVDKNRAIGTQSVLTIPAIEYINKSSDWICSFPESLYGSQQSYNPYVHPNGDNCGNGVSSSGQNITDTHVDRHDIPNEPSIQTAWVQHLVSKYGNAANGGVPIYQLDNEPHNWGYLHRDVHPNAVTEDEIIAQNITYAQAVKAADPSAKVAGPSEIQFGWYPDWGGDANTIQYLQQLKAYDQQHGGHLVDFFDVHYPDANDNHYPNLTDITHLRQVVDQIYPEMGISVSEWNGGSDLTGALFVADQLGLYAQNNVAFASYWDMDPNSPPAYTYRMYRNYDGHGGMFGQTLVQASSSNASQLSVYGAIRDSDGALTLIAINKTSSDLTSGLSLANFTPSSTAQVYTYSNANLTAIVKQPDQVVSSAGFSATYPANSITLVVIPGAVGSGTGLSQSGWSATASSNSDAASMAIDGNPYTRWSTGTPQTPGQYFQVDLSTTQSFSQLVLDATNSPNDYPRGYSIYVSNDGTNWGNPIANGSGSSAVTTITFPTQSARYIKINQTGSDPYWWWSIHEINVYP
ncbi:MAG: discoidin domain-containing protein [Chroococcidiopsidaceae cyanobacterium CP_BM_ER_R8_30]|nr:discoidin domain-containing protein [Chroococcidiopsidaceae cyanobacterium CP_BM_ER_R8_30]